MGRSVAGQFIGGKTVAANRLPITRAHAAAQAVGSAGVFVDAKDEAAARFYQQYGFVSGADTPLKLFLPLW